MKSMILTKRMFFLLMSVCVFSFSAMAAEKPAGNPAAVEVKLIGNIDDMQAFQLVVNGKEADEYVISITDTRGNLLGKEWVNGTFITRKYAISSDVPQDETLLITVRAKKAGTVSVYELRNAVTSVKVVEINRVK